MVWLLPEPDSPTMATVSPGLMSRSMPFTACRIPSPVRKRTLRLRRESTGSAMSAILRVESIAQAIADEVQAEQDRDKRQCGIDQHPGGILNALGAFRDQNAKAGIGLLDTKSEEGQEAFEQDHARHHQGHVDHNRPKGVRDHVPADDAFRLDAERLCGLDIFLPLDRERLPP